MKRKIIPYIEENPEREIGYNTIFKNFLIFGSIPWLIIGIGNLSGLTKSIFDYFQPSNLNPIVLIFHFSIIIIWLLLLKFIFLNDGAVFLEKHPGIIRFKSPGFENENLTSSQIKLFSIFIIVGGIIGMILMWNIQIPSI
ncbi:MAG: hypothetical protein V4670_00455 [Bacteroidota bacterium]